MKPTRSKSRSVRPMRPSAGEPAGDLQPLPSSEFFALKPGDRFVVFWAKDDSPSDVRLNYEEQVVASVGSDGTIYPTDAGYEWSLRERTSPRENVLNTSRGYAYLFRVPARATTSLKSLKKIADDAMSGGDSPYPPVRYEP